MRHHRLQYVPRTSCSIFVVLFIWAALVPASGSWASTSGAQVTAALNNLDNWLDTSPHGAGWSRFLRNDLLREQLAKGEQADVTVVSSILRRYSSGKPGLDIRYFVAVRDALHNWSDELAGQSTQNLVAVTRSVPDRYVAPGSAQLASAKTAVRGALDRLNGFLSQSPARAAGWKQYLDWDVIQQQLQADQPDLKQLESIVKRMSAPEDGLGMPQFKDARQALRTYIDRQFAVLNPDKVKERLAKISAELVASLEKLTPGATHRESLAVGGRLNFMERYGAADHLGRLVRQRFSHPNLVGYASEDLMNGAVGRAIDEPNRIRDNILGTYVTGNGVTQGQVRLTLVPSPSGAVFDISMRGVNNANTIGQVRNVNIHSRSKTQLSARTQIAFVPDSGMTASPVRAWAQSLTNIQNITADSRFERLVTRIAWKKAGQQKSSAEWEASRKARLRLQRRFERQIADMIRDVNDRYQNKFRKPLTRKDLFPELFALNTTDEAVHLSVRKAFADQLAAPFAAEPLPSGHDAALRVHESMINNVAAHLLGGRKFDNADADRASESEQFGQLRKFVKVHNVGETPEDKKDAPWEITLASTNPVTINFREGKIKITVRGTRFLGIDEQEYKRPMSVWTEFAVAHGTDGSLWLNLQAWDVEATAVETGGKFQPADAPLRSKLRARLKDILGPQDAEQKLAIQFQPITPEGEAARLGKLVYTLCDPDKAWLTVAVNRSHKIGSIPARDATAASAW